MANSVCGPFSQTLFLGASIISFTSSLGWNGDQGRLVVTLVEDTCRGTKVFYDTYGNPQITSQPDFFNPPKVGSPVYFRFGDFSFGGILQNWEQQTDGSSGRTYTVQCTDATEILEGTQVIINNYTGGTFGVPNLINAFGFNESLFSSCDTSAYTSSFNPPLGYTPAAGFGGANVAEDGMSWFQIKYAIQQLTNTPSSVFGGNLKLRTTSFFLDISELPSLDANFRFTGESVSLLEAISQVCASAGRDYFIELLYFTPNHVPAGYGGIGGLLHPDVLKFIKVRTVGRTVQKTSAYNVDLTVGSPINNRLNLGKITQFIGTGVGTNRSARGLELRHDITNAFLVGDNRQDLWIQAYTGSHDTYTDTIWPYWGKDNLGFPIISSGINDDHVFTVATTGWGTNLINILGSTYQIKFAEIRAALAGMEEWATYLWTEKESIASNLEIDASFTYEFMNTTSADADVKPVPNDAKKTDVNAIKIAAKHAGKNVDNEVDFVDKAELQKKLYDIVRSYSDFAGKKFLVSLPIICTASDTSAPFSVKLNWVPSDGAWTDSNIQLHSSSASLSPDSPIIELMRLDDGRIQGFVYYNTGDSTKIIDYTQLSPDEVIPISNTECYVKATVEEITFLNPLAQTYPRAVISINNVVAIKGTKEAEIDAPIVDNLAGFLMDNPPEGWIANKKGGNIGDDTNKLKMFPLPIIPLGAAVPLRSTNLSYGPWVTTLSFGPDAKTSYERDTSLSPWSFGNTNVMNYAGQIKVETQVTQQIVSEAGSVTVPGAPTMRLGAILMAGGPEVTNIDVEVGLNGVTSSLRFRTWVPNFGEIGRRRVETLRRAGTYQQKLQRAFIRNNSASTVGVRFGNWVRELTKSDRFNRNSSHSVIAAEVIDDYSVSSRKRPNVVITDLRKVLPEMYDDYAKKAVMDISGLFRPFETDGTGVGLSAFTRVTPTATSVVTSLSLNPFKTSEIYNGSGIGHDIDILTRGASVTGIIDLSIKKAGSYGSDSVRGIGLRAPLVLVGWGFDTNGKPVPNAMTTGLAGDEFAHDYLQKPELWKAGPLDVRWDETRGVWSAAGSSFRIAKLVQNLRTGFGANAHLGNITIISGLDGYRPVLSLESGLTLVFDALYNNAGLFVSPNLPATPSGATVYVQKEQTSNQWFVTGAAVW